MVTGRRPSTGTSWHLVNQHIKEQPAPPRTLRPDAPWNSNGSSTGS
ncbi:hypothetical protein [Streptomyces sp. 2231.1]|nr:hypothetical protein [Streptomyces sp. 2231.1]